MKVKLLSTSNYTPWVLPANPIVNAIKDNNFSGVYITVNELNTIGYEGDGSAAGEDTLYFHKREVEIIK